MILETVRIIADWLADPTYGINEALGSVPADTGVAVAPPVIVLDSTRDPITARGMVPELPSLPAILVTPNDSPVDMVNPSVRPFPPDATISVLIRYVASNSDTAEAERDASQTLKAIWWQVPQLMLTTAGETARTRARVQLYQIQNMAAQTLYEPNADTMITAAVLVTCRVRYLGPS